MSKAQMVKIITLMFTCYGQGNEAERIAAYVQMLGDIPVELLDKVCRKAIQQCKYLPSIAELREAAQSLIGTLDDSQNVKNWAEAQKEILKGMSRTWYHGCMGEIPITDPRYGLPCEPIWSKPEIAAAVDAYGFENLQRVLASDMPMVWAQLRRLYEQACQRKDEVAVNELVLSGDAARLKQIVQATGLLEVNCETNDRV